jgi:hypothetical protein
MFYSRSPPAARRSRQTSKAEISKLPSPRNQPIIASQFAYKQKSTEIFNFFPVLKNTVPLGILETTSSKMFQAVSKLFVDGS